MSEGTIFTVNLTREELDALDWAVYHGIDTMRDRARRAAEDVDQGGMAQAYAELAADRYERAQGLRTTIHGMAIRAGL